MACTSVSGRRPCRGVCVTFRPCQRPAAAAEPRRSSRRSNGDAHRRNRDGATDGGAIGRADATPPPRPARTAPTGEADGPSHASRRRARVHRERTAERVRGPPVTRKHRPRERKMGKYSFDPDQAVESSKARGSALRAHFKHCREVCHNIKGMKLPKAKAYLEDVLQFKQAVAFTKFTGGCGRHAQGKLRNAAGSKCRWPQKATKIVFGLLKNAEANAEMKGLDVDELIVKHSQANRAPYQRRRTYRAHGRIKPSAHGVAGAHRARARQGGGARREGRVGARGSSRKQAARLRVTAGGGTPA